MFITVNVRKRRLEPEMKPSNKLWGYEKRNKVRELVFSLHKMSKECKQEFLTSLTGNYFPLDSEERTTCSLNLGERTETAEMAFHFCAVA